MLSHKSILANFTRHLALLVLVLLMAGLASAQTPIGPADKLSVKAKLLEPESGSASTKATATGSVSASTTATADSVKAEADPKDAKADPPKDQPITSPAPSATPTPAPPCKRSISADVVAIAQPIMLNRLGAAVPDGSIFALASDTIAGHPARLKETKRPRPLVLRANVGDCLTIRFANLIPQSVFANTKAPLGQTVGTTEVSLHVQSMEWVKGSQDDGSFVGTNNSSLASVMPPAVPPQKYTLYAREEGTFLLYTEGDSSTQGLQLMRGLFGALNVEPAGAEWYRSQVTADDLALATYNANSLPATPTLNATLNPGCSPSATCILTIKKTIKDANNQSKLITTETKVIRTPSGYLNTLDNHPLINYDAVYPAKRADGTPIPDLKGTPILKILDANNKIVHSDLTAIITGPNAGRFPGVNGIDKPDPPCSATSGNVNPLFCQNPASPDRKQPYREVTIIYHEMMNAVTAQAFPAFNDFTSTGLGNTIAAGKDAFSINYGTGGIAAEVFANRIGVGPMGDCVDCKFEEFFLSAWSVGDPAMLVDHPANSNNLAQTGFFESPCGGLNDFANNTPCTGTRTPNPNLTPNTPYTMQPKVQATVALFPDDPSNVYHSYINDHVKFRILHGGTGVTHVHHQHAHQWLQSPNSDEGSYLDSQMISPGASYTLEMVYNGSGNRNKVVGDSIFHCHFYPHFAAGMWSMWRTHDVFESGTFVYPKSSPKAGQVVPGSRALPDGEIIAGTPTPAVVPLPTLPMAPLPAYAQIQNNVTVQGAPTKFGGQVVIGGKCSGGKINGLNVIGGCPAGASVVNGTVINSQFNGTQMTGQFQPSPANQLVNPGFPYFIPGIAGARAPHPPLDFAPDTVNGGFLDGGLPRHLVFGGSVSNEKHTQTDWSKDLATMNVVGLPEGGTDVEKAAMTYFGKRCYATFLPDGTPGSCPPPASVPPQSTLNSPPTGFVLNGLPRGPQSGAPFADPAVDDNGLAIGSKRTYKAAAIQMNVVFNKKELGWHYPQQRLLTLWQDVSPTIATTRKPEPLFFRGNSGDIIEYWHTNLVPDYYQVDDFQVRTPTDIIGQHIHLVKFDVTSSDGAANGYNYEDGTLSPGEVQHIYGAINTPGGSWKNCAGCATDLRPPQPPPTDICSVTPTPPQCANEWKGAQTTIQRWFLDPLLDNAGVDRTMRTVFTHDHFGPSTHQQAGLYAGLLIEPQGSTWQNSEDGTPMPDPVKRSDGGPTSWKANIITTDKAASYREFALEFQDFVLAYQSNPLPGKCPAKSVDPTCINTKPNAKYPDPDPAKGYMDPAYAIGAPNQPTLISTLTVGTQTVNYLNEPIPWRLFNPANSGGNTVDISEAFNSSNDPTKALLTGDPATPLMRAYQGDNVQVRLLVGAHMFAHQFNLEGPTWFAEPSWKNSGYRSVQAMGLSEHFELLFHVPGSTAPKIGRKCPDGMSAGNCADYLYSPSFDETGVANGMWGLFRAYDPNVVATNLTPLPNNPIAPSSKIDYTTCPAKLDPPFVTRVFKLAAVTAQQALALRTPVPGTPNGQIVFNSRNGGDPNNVLRAKLGIMYVLLDDLDAQGHLKDGVPIEPLILRANAGDCIEVSVKNMLDPNSDLFGQQFGYPQFLDNPAKFAPAFPNPFASKLVGLHPQLLTYDALVSTGINVGYNSKGQVNQVGKNGDIESYEWYAGKIDGIGTGTLIHTPVEFGSLNLFPSDPMFQNSNGLFGSMIIEPQGSMWTCDAVDIATGKLTTVSCEQTPDPTKVKNYTRASATVTFADRGIKPFREFAVMISDSIRISQNNSSAINYRTEPQSFRYAGNGTNDFSCMLSNQLVNGDPQTPIFTAETGDKVRFRMTHPFGTGTSQVFTLHGHVWQRNPYFKDSTEIGSNSLSQWLGSRDNHGSTDHFELVVDKAGGEGGQAGDYLYSVYLPGQAKLGAWGVFRVGHSNVAPQLNAACRLPAAPGQNVAPKEQPDIEQMIRKPAPANKDPNQ
jgi:hypothetical protein